MEFWINLWKGLFVVALVVFVGQGQDFLDRCTRLFGSPARMPD